ncbi:MAG: ribonuclease III domain-containing protein [Synechococcus sp.]|nr:ribonuclease III domain-containing protein [Synechococcus sp.]
MPLPDRRQPGPAQLAWLGDAVWELHQRQRLVHRDGSTAALHRQTVALVRAEAQSNALAQLEPLLQPEELDLVRKGRNAAGRGPRRSDPGIYGRASGFETMVGWLYLNNPQRLDQLLSHLEEVSPGDAG